MYEKYFQLRERPFSLSPDPDYLYPSKVHQEALGYLRYGIEGHAGFVVITGEIGSGKTTMLQSLLGRLDRNTTVARLVNTMLDPRELLEAIMLDFGMDPTGLSKPVLLQRLADFLVKQRQSGRLTLLAIDEAQNLGMATLEEIRMLSNLETEKSKLIQIVMVGQPELRDTLALPQLEQLRQRITVSYHLQPLDADETAKYVNHRLKRAALGAAIEFPRAVTDLIYTRSRGVPRIINVIADATLLLAYGVDRRDIDMAVTREAIAELDATGVLASYQREAEPRQGLVQHPGATATFDDDEARRRADEVRLRERALADRERQVAQREHAIAMQQRVLEEEARLLAASRAARLAPGRTAATVAVTTPAPAADASASAIASTPAGPAPGPVTVAPPLAPARTSIASGEAPVAVRPVAKSPTMHAPQMTPTYPASAVRVQPYPRFASVPQHPGMWQRLRRVLFGASESRAGV